MVTTQGREFDALVIQRQTISIAGLLTIRRGNASGTDSGVLSGTRTIDRIVLGCTGACFFEVEVSTDQGANFNPVFSTRLNAETKEFPFGQIIGRDPICRVRATPTGAQDVNGVLTSPQVA